MSEIIYRTLEEGDIPGVNAFYNSYHNGGRTAEQFRWEFLDGPNGKGIYCLAKVVETGQIIGIQGGIPIIFMTKANQHVLTIKSEDTLIDVDLCARLKKRNLFRELYDFFVTQCREQGVECIWGFTWAKNSLKRIGFQLPFDACQGILVLHPVKSYRHLSGLNKNNKFLDKAKIGVMVAFSFLVGWKCRYHNKLKGLIISEEILSNLEIIQSIAEIHQDLVFMKQDTEFLLWRLKKNLYPIKYTVLNLNYNGLFAGQIITSLFPNFQGFLEQVLFVPELQLRTQKKILKNALIQIRMAGAIHIRVMTFPGNEVNRQQKKLFRSIGFSLIKKGMGFIFLSLKDTSAFRPKQFFLSRIFTQGHN